MDASSPSEFVLLERLARHPGVFVDDLADSLSQSVEALTRLGYEVEVHPVNGVRLRHGVDAIDRDRVRRLLVTDALGRALVCHLQVASTNDEAWQLESRGAPSGATVTAEHQTAGRGRLGRAWFSPPGSGLWLSVLLRPDWSIDRAGLLTLGAGVAVAEAIASLGVECDLKWPNDVQIEGRKVAGILTESRTESDRLAVAVVGVGVNVHQDVETFPPELRTTATSLRVEGCRVERSDLLGEILNRLESVTALEPENLLAEWQRRAAGWGECVRVEMVDETIIGRMASLTTTGALVLELSDGTTRTIHAGDLHRLREVES